MGPLEIANFNHIGPVQVLNLWVLLPVSYTQEWKEQTKPVFLSQE
jgi:hypothetical protein